MNLEDLCPQCPKCGAARRANQQACPRCGLLQTLWDTFVASPPEPSAGLAAAWQKLGQAWEDETLHKRFLDLAANLDALNSAASLYRAHLRQHPADPFARAGLERVAHLASVIGSQRAATATVPSSLRAISVLVATGLLAIAIQLVRLSLHR